MCEELTLLPCPACGNPDAVVSVTTRAAVYCPMCGMCGPCSPKVDTEYVVRQWNALPRAMMWTDEPPKVPGYYWCRYKGSGKDTWSPTYIPACADHTKYTILFKSKDVEWAGPIPEPREPKEQGGYDG